MGDQRARFAGKNDFYAYTYNTLSPRVKINGVSGKMVDKKYAFHSNKPSLPAYKGKSDMYFSPDKDGKAIQAKLYDKNGRMRLDFDWNHTHKNKDGTIFPKGTVHIQEYKVNRVKNSKTGKWEDQFKRIKSARRMTPEEIIKYGPILHYFNPDIEF